MKLADKHSSRILESGSELDEFARDKPKITVYKLQGLAESKAEPDLSLA